MSIPSKNTSQRPSLWAALGLASWRGRLAWFVGTFVLALVVCLILARATPAWYRPLDPTDQRVIDASGRGQTLITFDLHTAVERVPLGEQRWSISQDELNAFFAVNSTALPATGDARSAMDPARNPVSDPFIIFGKGEFTVAARLTKLPSSSPQGGVGSATFSVRVTRGADGTPQALVELQRVRAGVLPIPQFIVKSRIENLVPALTEAAGHVAQIQMGIKEMDKAGPEIQQVVQGVVSGTPFPLHFKFDKKEFLVSDLLLEPGRFTLVLVPVKPAGVRPRPPTPQNP